MKRMNDIRGSFLYRGIRRLFGELGRIDIWERISSYYLWNCHKLYKSQRLFQVIGVTRSGTTLLCSFLDSHSQVICLSEPYHQWKYDGVINTESIKDIVNAKLYRGHPSKLISKLVNKTRDEVLVGFKEIYYTKTHGHYSNAFFFKRNYRNGITTLVIIRDPREIWKSLTLKHPEKKGFVTERFVESWNDLVGWVTTENVFYVKYEELVHNTVEVLKRICLFLNLEFKESMLYLKAKQGRGDQKALAGGLVDSSKNLIECKQYLSLKEINFIVDHCRHYMNALNYL